LLRLIALTIRLNRRIFAGRKEPLIEEKGRIIQLTLVRGLTKEQQNVIKTITNNTFNAGSWKLALERRDDMLRDGYAHPDIPDTDPQGRMAALRDDIEDALRDMSYLSAKHFPHDGIAKELLGIGCANACDEVTQCETELASENRMRHFSELVDLLWRAAPVRGSTESVYRWLDENGRPTPNNSDLMRLALAEMNADRIGAALPRVLVLPNAHDPLKPTPVWVSDDVTTDADTAESLRILFSR